MKYIDISRTIYSGMKKYHSDPEVKVQRFKSLDQGDSCNLKKIVFGSHTGTHVDAGRHVFKKGNSVESIKFQDLICDIYLIDAKNLTEKALLRKINKVEARGIILKNAYGGLTIQVAKILIRNKMKVVGTDQLSIEKNSDKSHPVHRSLLSSGITIIEDLDLRSARTGYYKLLCLPLKIKNGDGAPARAVLVHD